MNDPVFDQPYVVEEHAIENAVMVVFGIGNDAFQKEGVVRETLAPPSYKVELYLIVQYLRHWLITALGMRSVGD